MLKIGLTGQKLYFVTGKTAPVAWPAQTSTGFLLCVISCPKIKSTGLSALSKQRQHLQIAS